MLHDWTSALTLYALLGSGLMAGLFFTFSMCVMKALASLPPAHGMAAMRAINATILNPWFALAFAGTALACGVASLASLSRWSEPRTVYLLTGSALYLLGAIAVTFAFNVPRNQALAAIDPASPEAAELWARYVPTWTAWNHVRTVASLAATAAFAMALR